MKRAPVVMCLLMIFLSMSGCGQQETGKKIEFWTLQLRPTYDAYFQSLLKEYESAHPGITIQWVDIPYDAATQKLMAAVAAGQAPDIVNMSSDFLAKFSSMNAFADFSALLPRDSLVLFFPHALTSCTYDGKVIALPWYLNTYVLIYNEKLLADAGLNRRDVPKTFSELVAFVRKYKDTTGRFALFWNIGKDSYLPVMLESEGVDMTDSGMSRATFNSPRGVALVSQWVDLYRQGYLQRESIINRGTSIIEAYQSGQVAMVLTGPVFLERVRANAPAVYAQTDVAPNPVGAAGKQELATMTLSVLSTSRLRREAADVAMFVLSAKNQIAFAKITTTYPSVTEALKDSFFTVSDGTPEGNARVVGARELPSACTLSRYKTHSEYLRLHEIFGEAVQKACLGTMSTQDALDDAAAAWNRILGVKRKENL